MYGSIGTVFRVTIAEEVAVSCPPDIVLGAAVVELETLVGAAELAALETPELVSTDDDAVTVSLANDEDADIELPEADTIDEGADNELSEADNVDDGTVKVMSSLPVLVAETDERTLDKGWDSEVRESVAC